MSAQFKKSNIEHDADRASLRADSGNMTIRGPERYSTQGQEQNSIREPIRGRTQFGAAAVGERNTKHLNQMGIHDAEPQILEFVNLSLEEQTQTTTSSGKPENSRRKMDRLVDDNSRLRMEIEALRNERDAAHDALDKMLSDLIATQKELEEEKDGTARKETELSARQQDVDRLSTELEEKKHYSTAMERLFMERENEVIGKKEIELLELKQKVNRLSVELKKKVATPKDETEVLDLRQQVDKLIADVEGKEKQLSERDNALRKQEKIWQAELRKQHEGARAEITEQRTQLEKAEAQLQALQLKHHSVDEQQTNRHLAESSEAALLTQLETEKSKAGQYLQELQQLRASHAAELEELRRLSNFFKNNSERLSRQTSDLMATNRNLHESFQAKDREIEEQASQIYALRLQQEELQNHFSL